MAKPIHSMIRVLDEEKSIAFYSAAFGMTVKDRLDFENFTLVYLVGSGATFELELTVNKGREEPYDLGMATGTWPLPSMIWRPRMPLVALRAMRPATSLNSSRMAICWQSSFLSQIRTAIRSRYCRRAVVTAERDCARKEFRLT